MRTLDADRQGRLRDVSILLSASVPDREGFERVPDAAFVIEQAVVSLARAVLAEEGTLVFGAHPSISPLVASVASEYRAPGGKEEPRVVIYQSKAFEKVLPRETWDMARFGFARLIWIDAEGGESYIPGQPASRHCPRSLRSMRQHMVSDEEAGRDGGDRRYGGHLRGGGNLSDSGRAGLRGRIDGRRRAEATSSGG